MAKIIKIGDEGTVYIARDNGSVIEVADYSLDFVPRVNDVVEVYDNRGDYIVNRKEVGQEKQGAFAQPQQVVVHAVGRPVNKIAYVLFAFFLGGFGAHKFYSGRIFQGIMYIAFSWTFIPSVIALIEGILAITRPADANGIIII